MKRGKRNFYFPLPKIETFPHHFHNLRAQVENSDLKGVPEKDLSLVLDKIVESLI